MVDGEIKDAVLSVKHLLDELFEDKEPEKLYVLQMTMHVMCRIEECLSFNDVYVTLEELRREKQCQS